MAIVTTNNIHYGAIADAIREKSGGTASYKPAEMAAAIRGIQAGGGAEVIKAFVSLGTPSSNQFVNKRIAPVPADFKYGCRYTNTASEMTLELSCESGDNIICAAAYRKITTCPEIPDGWSLVAYIPPHSQDPSAQSLLILKTKATQSGTLVLTLTQSTSSQRFYALMINLRDTEIGAGRYVQGSQIAAITTPALFEHTLLINTSTTSIEAASTPLPWKHQIGSFTQRVFPSYGDDVKAGGRLNMEYVPWSGETTFADSNPRTFEYEILAKGGKTNGAIVYALELIPNTFSKWKYLI